MKGGGLKFRNMYQKWWVIEFALGVPVAKEQREMR